VTGGTDRLGDAFQRVAQRPQVHVPVDATELLAGLLLGRTASTRTSSCSCCGITALLLVSARFVLDEAALVWHLVVLAQPDPP
jgi:hypothetical protein